MRFAGLVSIRKDEIEERGLALIPGTTWEGCSRCGEKIAMSPAMQGIRRGRGLVPWCWDCVYETNPHGFALAADRSVIEESITLRRLESREGPIH